MVIQQNYKNYKKYNLRNTLGPLTNIIFSDSTDLSNFLKISIESLNFIPLQRKPKVDIRVIRSFAIANLSI